MPLPCDQDRSDCHLSQNLKFSLTRVASRKEESLWRREDVAAGRPIFPRMRRLRHSHWAVFEETWPVHNFLETSTAGLQACNATSSLSRIPSILLPASSVTRRCHILLQRDNPDAFTYVQRHRYCPWPLVFSAREAAPEAAPCICPGADYLSLSRNP